MAGSFFKFFGSFGQVLASFWPRRARVGGVSGGGGALGGLWDLFGPSWAPGTKIVEKSPHASPHFGEVLGVFFGHFFDDVLGLRFCVFLWVS